MSSFTLAPHINLLRDSSTGDSLRAVRLRRIVALCVGALLAATPVRAQSAEFVANLTSGNRPVPSGAIVQPFVGETAAAGWAVVTVDSLARTVSYTVTIVNPPSTPSGRLFVTGTGLAVPVIPFGPPVPTSIVLNNISDDLCYEVPAVSFQGTVKAADLVLGPEQGIRTAEDVVAAITAGKAYVTVGSATQPVGGLRGQLAKRF
jgi:hypothetical protein